MKAEHPSVVRSTCEVLEGRRLLSAATAGLDPGALAGTYWGVLSTSLSPHRRDVAITIASEANHQLTGDVAAVGLGTFGFAGRVTGNTFQAVFGGSAGGAGVITGHLTANGLVGTIAEQAGGIRIAGSFRVTPGGTAVMNATLPPVVQGATLNQRNVVGTYGGASTLHGPSVGSSAKIATTSLQLTAESADGLLAGSLTIPTATFNVTGLISGSRLDLILSGAQTGDVMATVSPGNTALHGTLVETLSNGGVLRGPMALTNPAAVAARQAAARARATGYPISTIFGAAGGVASFSNGGAVLNGGTAGVNGVNSTGNGIATPTNPVGTNGGSVTTPGGALGGTAPVGGTLPTDPGQPSLPTDPSGGGLSGGGFTTPIAGGD